MIVAHQRCSALRLLFLLPFAPRLDATNGGSRVMAQLLAALATRHHVAVIYFRAAEEPPIDEVLLERCALLDEVRRPNGRSRLECYARRARYLTGLIRGRPLWATNWAVGAYGRRVRDLAMTWRPDLIQIDYHVMGQYLPLLDGCPAPRVLIDYEAGVSTAEELRRSLKGASRLLAALDLWAWRRFEPAVLRRVQAVVVFTERDRQAVSPWAGQTPIVRIPFSTQLPQAPLSALGMPPLSLLFVGNFTHHPNVDAADRLITAILPGVQTRHPQLILNIVGDQPPSHLLRLRSCHVNVTGRVPDVTPYLDHAALVVMPLRLGGGMRVKLLEALAAGKAIIASSLAIEGLELTDGQEVILADSDDQFIQAIDRLRTAPEMRAALGARARAWACAHLGWEQPLAAYEALYRRLIGCCKEA